MPEGFQCSTCDNFAGYIKGASSEKILLGRITNSNNFSSSSQLLDTLHLVQQPKFTDGIVSSTTIHTCIIGHYNPSARITA